MKKKTDLTVNANFGGSAYAYVTNNWFVDHTSVTVSARDGGTTGFGCSGDIGKPGDKALFSNFKIDLKYAALISSYQQESCEHAYIYDRRFYNRTGTPGYYASSYPNWGDCCGLKYGLQGVCHTMANRILLAGDGQTKTVNGPGGALDSRSSALSFFLYGYYGDIGMNPANNSEYISWVQYLSWCDYYRFRSYNTNENISPIDMIASLSDDERIKITNDYIDMFKKKLDSDNSSNDDFYTRVMKHELDNIGSEDLPTDRIKMFFEEQLGNDSGIDMQSIIDAFKKVDSVIKQANKLDQSKNSDDIESYYASLNNLNSEIRLFDKSSFKTLGAEKYELAFGEKYEEDINFLFTK